MVEIHPEDVALVRETFVKSMEEGRGQRIEYRMRRKDGSWVTLESEGRVAKNWNGHEGGKGSKLTIDSQRAEMRHNRLIILRAPPRSAAEEIFLGVQVFAPLCFLDGARNPRINSRSLKG